MKRKLFIAFVLVLAAGLLCCCAALADQSGTCGDGVTWAFNSATGALTISGTGAMEEYSIFNAMPWYDLKDEIRTVTVEDGVTAVSGMAFNYCSNLTGATVRASVESIGYLAFHGCTSLTRVTILNPDCVIGDIDYDVFDGCPSSLVLFGQQGSTANIYALAAGLSFAAASGTGGGDVTWTFDSVSGVLTVSGSGLMNNFSASGTPMAGLRPYITSVVIEKGVRSIGQNFFNGCSLLGSISVGDDVEKIRQNAFDGCTALTRVVLPESL